MPLDSRNLPPIGPAISNVTLGGVAAASTNGSRLAPAILDRLRLDPAMDTPGMAPGYGQHPLPHVMTMQGLVATVSRVYRMDDEALRDSLQNARYMELDVGIRECLEARWRSTALLNWHLEPDNPSSTEQVDFCAHFTKILKKIPEFMQFRETLLRATWYGRYAASCRYNWGQLGPTEWALWPHDWRPVHGDKLVFRLDDGDHTRNPQQVGVRIGYTLGDRVGGYGDRIEVSDRGRVYMYTEAERKLLVIHRHQREDAAFEDLAAAGKINGTGLRSRIYWEWVQKQETLRWMMEYLERSAFGVGLWYYPEGNDAAKSAMVEAANKQIQNFRNQIFVPVPNDGSGNTYGLQHVETGMAGMAQIQELVTKYFGHRIKRLILGQTLTSESEGGGLGSDGIARVHLGTFKDIVTYDARNLEETISNQLVGVIKAFNFPRANFGVRFVIETEEIDSDERLQQVQMAWGMGARISEKKVLDAIGLAVPGEDDVTLQNPQIVAAQQQLQAAQMAGPGGMPGGAAAGGVGHRDGTPHDATAAGVRHGLAREGRLQVAPGWDPQQGQQEAGQGAKPQEIGEQGAAVPTETPRG
jgi:hypothetical protein